MKGIKMIPKGIKNFMLCL